MTSFSSNITGHDGPLPIKVARARPPTKKAQLISLLQRRSGSDVKTLSAALNWQPHTTRAAVSGLRKEGFLISKETAKAGGAPRYYIRPHPVFVSQRGGRSVQ